MDDIVSLFNDKNRACKLYADDVTVNTALQTKADYYSLQTKLNQLFERSERRQLTISYNK